VSASGHDLDIVGETSLLVKIGLFTWKWNFLVSKNIQGMPIWGADFMSKTRMILDLAKQRCFFGFFPGEYIPLMKGGPNTEGRVNNVLVVGKTTFQCGKLEPNEKERLEGLISKYPDVLTAKLGLTHVLKYDIQLIDKTPVRLSPYRLSPPKMKYLKGHIEKLLQDGVIETSSSHYSSPMFLVPKPQGEYRAVVDFRALNKKSPLSRCPCRRYTPPFIGSRKLGILQPLTSIKRTTKFPCQRHQNL
jgi:hypothetical protein